MEESSISVTIWHQIKCLQSCRVLTILCAIPGRLMCSGSEFYSKMSHYCVSLEQSISSKCLPTWKWEVLVQSSLYGLLQESLSLCKNHRGTSRTGHLGQRPLFSRSLWPLLQTAHWGCVHYPILPGALKSKILLVRCPAWAQGSVSGYSIAVLYT